VGGGLTRVGRSLRVESLRVGPGEVGGRCGFADGAGSCRMGGDAATLSAWLRGILLKALVARDVLVENVGAVEPSRAHWTDKLRVR
jgi:hypothetical protein